MSKATALLVIGTHRDELAFGREVAASLQKGRVEVLTIPEGISGQRPLAGQEFRYETLHRMIYSQLLPHVLGRHGLLIDLHTGFDSCGPSADLICADPVLRDQLESAVREKVSQTAQDIRVIPLGTETSIPHAHTVIPRQIWENPAFTYVGLEVYLPKEGSNQEAGRALALDLIELIVGRAN
jgi:hypothetical protein